jgi:hypothetical protein
MEPRIFDYLTSRQLPTGRRIFAVKAIRKAAEGYGDAKLVALCDASIAFDRETLRLEMNYQKGKSFASDARGKAAEYDLRIDALFTGIYSVAQGHAVGGLATAETAGEFMKTIFPDGLAGLIQLSFEEQLARVHALLERFDGDLAAAVDEIGARRHVDELKVVVPKFRVELEKETGRKVTYPMVKDARAEGLDKFALVVFAVLSTYGGDSSRDAERRKALLAEYHRQNARIAEAYRRQEAVKDVDPDTGEPLIDDATDQPAAEDVESVT